MSNGTTVLDLTGPHSRLDITKRIEEMRGMTGGRVAAADGKLVVRPAVSWETIARAAINGLRLARNLIRAGDRSQLVRCVPDINRTLIAAEEDIVTLQRAGTGEESVIIDADDYRALLAVYIAAHRFVRSLDVGDRGDLALKVDAYERAKAVGS